MLADPTTPTTAFKMEAVYGDSVLMQYADQLTRAGQTMPGIPGRFHFPAVWMQTSFPLAFSCWGRITRKRSCSVLGMPTNWQRLMRTGAECYLQCCADNGGILLVEGLDESC